MKKQRQAAQGWSRPLFGGRQEGPQSCSSKVELRGLTDDSLDSTDRLKKVSHPCLIHSSRRRLWEEDHLLAYITGDT